jgi:hypothetical protein
VRTIGVAAVSFVIVCEVLAQSPPAPQLPISAARRVTWADLGSVHDRLKAAGLAPAAFPSFVERTHDENVRRVREGDLDHLIFYILQSTWFTSVPPIEPAISAKALVDSLGADERVAFLKESVLLPARVPQAVRDRIAAFLRAIGAVTGKDARLVYFRALTTTVWPDQARRADGLRAEYVRVMRFVFEKEFVAQRAEQPADAIAELYRTRGLSTDTAVEAGFLVYYGLGIAQSLDPQRRIRRVLIVGPGLDLAPRTSLQDERPSESYQPWAVIDALLTLKMARADDLEVVAADINPRVVEHLRRAASEPPTLTMIGEIRESETVKLSEDYRGYFTQLGRGIGDPEANPAAVTEGSPGKRIKVKASVARILTAVPLDIVTERLAGPPFDLIVATNILPYFDDVQLMLATSNIAAMTSPGGVFLHNESRAILGDLTTAVGLPFEQSRHAVIATVRGAKAPLFDSVFLHRKR